MYIYLVRIFISRSTDRPTGDVSDRDLSIDTLARSLDRRRP